MEENTQITNNAGTQPVGKAIILYGTVQATATDGTERALAPNSPVFMDDYISTGPDGMVLIIFNADHSHLELGWMSNAFIDHDVVGNVSTEDVEEMAADVADIQQALELGDINQILDMPAYASVGDDGDHLDAGTGTDALSHDGDTVGVSANLDDKTVSEGDDTLTMGGGTEEGTFVGVSSDDDADYLDSNEVAQGEIGSDSGEDQNIDDLVPPPDTTT